MPQMSPIVINDGKATPVAHTFSPSTDRDGVGVYFNGSAQTLVGREKIVLDPNASTPNGASRKTVISLYLPVESTDATGKIVVSRQTLVRVEMFTSASSMRQERKDAVTLARNLLANTDIEKVLVDAEGLW